MADYINLMGYDQNRLSCVLPEIPSKQVVLPGIPLKQNCLAVWSS